MSSHSETFSEFLKEIKKSLKITWEDLALQLDLPRSSLQNYVRGSSIPSYFVWYKISNHLPCDQDRALNSILESVRLKYKNNVNIY